MNSKQHTFELRSETINDLKPLNIPAEIMPYIGTYIEECNLHQMKNLIGNMPEIKKFIQNVIWSQIKQTSVESKISKKTKIIWSKWWELARTLITNIGEKIRRWLEFLSRDSKMTSENALVLCDKVKGKFTWGDNEYVKEIMNIFKTIDKKWLWKSTKLISSWYWSDNRAAA